MCKCGWVGVRKGQTINKVKYTLATKKITMDLKLL
jgi:hypothetical protein